MIGTESIVVTKIQNIYMISSEKGRRFTMKNRPCWGLSFCTEGQITYTHKGKRYVSDHRHAVFLPKGEDYLLEGNKTGVFPLVNFECAQPFCNTFEVIPISDSQSYAKDIKTMQELFPFERNGAKVMSLFYGILHRLSLEGKRSHLITPAISYIEKNYGDTGIGNEQLAKKCCISEVYLRQLFLKETGMTPKQFVLEVRLEKAKQMLSEGLKTVGEVSELCGFSNPYHFSRMFKEKSGVSPLEYRKNTRIDRI